MSNILGCYSTERLSSTRQPLCPWGTVETDPSDPGHSYKQGLFERHKCIYPRGAIHVGLWKFEEAEDYKFLIGSNLIGFEANPFVFESYSKVTCDLYGFQSFNIALGNYNKHDPWIKSSIKVPLDRNDCGGFYSDGKDVEVWKSSLDFLFSSENNILNIPSCKEFNFLNIDAEGAELEILKGSEELLDNIDYLILETSTDDRFNNGSTLDSITNFLDNWNFHIAEIEDGLINDRKWGDVFYVK